MLTKGAKRRAGKLRNYNEQISRILFDAEMNDGARLRAFEAYLEQVYEDGYDQAAQDITMKLQELIPAKTPTVADARVKGAWTDAAKVALNHLGKVSRRTTL